MNVPLHVVLLQTCTMPRVYEWYEYLTPLPLVCLLPSPDTKFSLSRGTLQYRGDDDKWHTVTEGAAVSTPYGNAWEMKNTEADLAAKRWRLHNWRSVGNQWLDGIDLVVSSAGA